MTTTKQHRASSAGKTDLRIVVRMRPDLLRLLDGYVRTMTVEHPGIPPSRATAIRNLLYSALLEGRQPQLSRT